MDKKRIEEDFKVALKHGDTLKVSVIRMILASIKNKEIEEKGELSEDKIDEIINKEAKKRKESITAYARSDRDDLREKEEKELELITQYLPEQLSEEALQKIVSKEIKELKAETKSDVGRVMGAVMQEVKGKADGNLVKKVVDNLLK